MPFNGSGVYSAPASPGAFNPAVAAGSADPTSWNALLTDISTALSTAICRDGQTVITADIPMSGHKFTSVLDASGTGEYLGSSQYKNNTVLGRNDTSGLAGSYAIASTIPTTYAPYQRFQFIALSANTGAATLNVNGSGAKTIKRPNGANLSDNDILAGSIADVIYDGTNFILLSGGNNGLSNSLLTTRGDLIRRGASIPERLALGTTGQILTSDGTDAKWSDPTGQLVATQTGSVATGTITIPYDDTPPLNTEGDQYMTLSITPKSATSKLLIEIVANCSSSAGDNITVALFQDATASALKAVVENTQSSGAMANIKFIHEMTSGTTSATTFKVRIGSSPSIGGTITFNGTLGGRLMGGVMASSITIQEIGV